MALVQYYKSVQEPDLDTQLPVYSIGSESPLEWIQGGLYAHFKSNPFSCQTLKKNGEVSMLDILLILNVKRNRKST